MGKSNIKKKILEEILSSKKNITQQLLNEINCFEDLRIETEPSDKKSSIEQMIKTHHLKRNAISNDSSHGYGIRNCSGNKIWIGKKKIKKKPAENQCHKTLITKKKSVHNDQNKMNKMYKYSFTKETIEKDSSSKEKIVTKNKRHS